MKKKIRKWIIIFFSSMIVLTIASRVIHNLYIIKVSTSTADSKEIAKTIESDGKIQGKNEVIIVTAENLLVSKINAVQGEEVKKGDSLYEIDSADVKNLIAQKEDEIKELRLQSAETASQIEAEQREKSINYKHASENYEAAVSNKEKSLKRAETELKDSQKTLKGLKNRLSDKQRQYKRFVSSKNHQRAEELIQEIEALKQEIEVANANIAEKEQYYNQTKEEQDNAIRSSKQELETAAASAAQHTTLQQNNIAIEQKQKELDKLESLMKNPSITAPCDGVVKEVLVTTGGRTANSADMVLIDKNSGLEAVSLFTQEGKEFLKKGELVLVNTGGDKKDNSEEYPITSVRITEDEMDAVEVKVDIPLSDLLVGSSVSISLKTAEKSYPTVIERSALHLDSDDKYYVFVIKERETLLGKELEAVKKDIKLIDKNETYAAVSGISENDEVIIESSKYINDGDLVKKEEE